MRPVYLAAPAVNGTFSPPCVLDYHLDPTNIMLTLELYGGTAGSYTVQYSPDDPYATYATDYNTNANWYNHPTMTGLSADAVDQLAVPARAVRLKTTTVQGGSPTSAPRLVVIQAGGIG